MNELYKADQCLADRELNLWTLNPDNQSTAANPTQFDLFSDRIKRMYPSYQLDSRCLIRPGPETPTVNLAQLKELLLSKNLSRNSELDWVSAENLRFLDGTDITGQQIALESIVRSGNSFLRRIIELITGVYTGSDMNSNVTLHFMCGWNMPGEETVAQDNLCWVTKTHWPMESPLGSKKF